MGGPVCLLVLLQLLLDFLVRLPSTLLVFVLFVQFSVQAAHHRRKFANIQRNAAGRWGKGEISHPSNQNHLTWPSFVRTAVPPDEKRNRQTHTNLSKVSYDGESPLNIINNYFLSNFHRPLYPYKANLFPSLGPSIGEEEVVGGLQLEMGKFQK